MQEKFTNSLLWHFSELQLPGLVEIEANHIPMEADNPWHDTQELEESEQMQILSDLLGKIIFTKVNPEQLSHAHFLASMVAHFVSCGKVQTQAVEAKIPLNVLVPKIQA